MHAHADSVVQALVGVRGRQETDRALDLILIGSGKRGQGSPVSWEYYDLVQIAGFLFQDQCWRNKEGDTEKQRNQIY